VNIAKLPELPSALVLASIYSVGSLHFRAEIFQFRLKCIELVYEKLCALYPPLSRTI
jgi:hypothetical protein